MDVLVKRHLIPMESIIEEHTFVLRAVYPKKAYVNNEPTADISGQTYECFNTKTFELIKVTVTQPTPIVTNKEIIDSLENGTPIIVEFEAAMIKVYMPKDSNQFAESITAKGIAIVKEG